MPSAFEKIASLLLRNTQGIRFLERTRVVRRKSACSRKKELVLHNRERELFQTVRRERECCKKKERILDTITDARIISFRLWAVSSVGRAADS